VHCTKGVKKDSNLYKGIHKGKVVVIDKDGKRFQVDKTDPRYISGELVSINTNKIMVRDKNGECFKVHKDDPRFISG